MWDDDCVGTRSPGRAGSHLTGCEAEGASAASYIRGLGAEV